MNETPLFQQYMSVKESCRDAILLFRLGDFYEMFGDDAESASKTLEIVLTKRDFGGDRKMPMCGVPHHSADNYIAKLLDAGYKVAIAEQTEQPTKGKKLVNREVVRIITPGTDLDPERLDSGRNNYLISIVPGREKAGIAMLDVSTGEFSAGEISLGHALSGVMKEVERIAPRECVVSAPGMDREMENAVREKFPDLKVASRDILFDPQFHRDRLCDQFKATTLRGYGIEDMKLAIIAAGQALEYVQDNLKTAPRHVRSISLYAPGDTMYLDPGTKRNLELAETIRGGSKKGSLLWVVDHTVTPMGRRMMRRWLERPLTDAGEINRRLDAVEELVNGKGRRASLQEILSDVRDLERLSSRVATGLVTPKELISIRDSLARLPEVSSHLDGLKSAIFTELRQDMESLEELEATLRAAISDDAPRTMRDGGIVRDGYDQRVEELRETKKGGRKWLVDLETQERENSGIKSLKVKYNKVFGYFIEITNSNLTNVPDHYIRKQTMSNCERYFTEELKEKENAILGAEGKLNDLEYEIFCEIRGKVADEIPKILKAAGVVASLDALVSLAHAASEFGYVRPGVTTSETIKITGGRHPVLDRTLPSHTFIPNDTHLSCAGNQVQIITGPNMAGKSTYMRQVALIVLMAQMGSFVPCETADIGVVDRIFTRVGAVDDIALGMSTFMVEMVETSIILNNATKRSLILLDEVGRGTGTTDGVSIAWAVSEYIHERIGARTMFATHFNELTKLPEHHERIVNFHVSAFEKGGEIVFTHKVREGGTDRSFGVEVARMAGVPASVLRRAGEIMASMENIDDLEIPENVARQLSLVDDQPPSRIEEALRSVDPEEMSPKKALEFIYSLKDMLEDR